VFDERRAGKATLDATDGSATSGGISSAPIAVAARCFISTGPTTIAGSILGAGGSAERLASVALELTSVCETTAAPCRGGDFQSGAVQAP
jgi:hypothetical protein